MIVEASAARSHSNEAQKLSSIEGGGEGGWLGGMGEGGKGRVLLFSGLCALA